MPVYSQADAETHRIIDRMVEKYHGKLRDAGVTIDALFAHPSKDKDGMPTGPALKHQGYEAYAVVRAIGLKDRTAGRGDAEIVINYDKWLLSDDAERDALIDHELEHLELTYDKDGLLKRDDLERPKLKIRLHDRQFGFFDSVARRHGPASIEVQQSRKFFESDVWRQNYLPGMEPGEAETKPKRKRREADPSHRPELAMAAGEE